MNWLNDLALKTAQAVPASPAPRPGAQARASVTGAGSVAGNAGFSMPSLSAAAFDGVDNKVVTPASSAASSVFRRLFGGNQAPNQQPAAPIPGR